MSITVGTPDGGIATFPDGMSQDAITAVLRQKFPPPPQQTSLTGTLTHGAERGVLPALTGYEGAIAGGEVGAGIGSVAGPIGTAIGGIGGGIAGAMGGGYLADKAQQGIVGMLPQGVQKFFGQDQATQQAEAQQHPYASMIGEMAPQALVMGPGAVGGAVREGASGLERFMASPTGSRLFGAGIMGGQQAGTDYAQTGQVDPLKVGIAAGAGAMLNKPTKLGEAMANPIHQVFRGPAVAPPVQQDNAALADALQQPLQAPPPPVQTPVTPTPPPGMPPVEPVAPPIPPAENNITAIQRKMTGEPPPIQPQTPAPQAAPAPEPAAPAPPEPQAPQLHPVVQDRLNSIAASSPAGKSFVDDLAPKIASGEVSPTQAYFAIAHIAPAIQHVLGDAGEGLAVKLLPELLGPEGQQAQGNFDATKSLLQFSLHPDALQYASETGGHEVFHVLQQALEVTDPKAAKVLNNTFNADTTPNTIPKTLKTAFQNTLYPVIPPGETEPVTYWDQMVKGQGGADQAWGSAAEAQAHVFGALDSMRRFGLETPTLSAPLQRFSKFVSDVKTRLANGLQGAGFQTPEDVMNAYSAGKAGEAAAPVTPPVAGVPQDDQQQFSTRQQDSEEASLQQMRDAGMSWRDIAYHPDITARMSQIAKSRIGTEGREPVPQFSARLTGNEGDAFPTFSALTKGVEDVQQAKAPPDQWAGIIDNLKAKGVKDAEVDWSGVKDWLAEQKGSVSKDDLVQYLKDHELKTGFSVKGGMPPVPEKVMGWDKAQTDDSGYVYRHIANSGEKILVYSDKEADAFAPSIDGKVIGEFPTFRAAAKAVNAALGHGAYAGKAEFEDYTPPGAQPGSYREAFLTAPEGQGRDFENWKDGHRHYSDIENPISRIRYNTRVDADGKRRLHVSEIQGPNEGQAIPEHLSSRSIEMGMKWALQHAVRNGYDRVSWDTGETNRKRYGGVYEDIRKITYDKSNGHLKIYRGADEDEPPDEDHVSEGGVRKLLGKEIGNRVIEKGEIEGEDTQFKGEGLKNLYDKKLPDFIDKYGKKWGLKTEKYAGRQEAKDINEQEEIKDRPGESTLDRLNRLATASRELDAGKTIHKVELTSQIKESLGVKQEKQPLWSQRKTDFDGETPLPPEIAYSRRKAAADIAQIPGLEKRMEDVYAPIDPKLSLLDRTKNFGQQDWKTNLSKLYMRTVDEAMPLARLDRTWAKKNIGLMTKGKDIIERSTGDDLSFQLSSYKMRSMVNRSAAHAGTDMFTAPFALTKDGDFTTSRVDKNGNLIKPTVQSGPYKGRQIDGLMQIWAPAYRAGIGEAFHFYMDATRGMRLAGEGREKLFRPGDKAIADQLEQKFNGVGMLGKDPMPNFKEMADMTHEFNKVKLDGMVKSGVLTRAAADHYLKTNDYTPFYREFEEEGVAGPVYVNGVNTGETVLHTKLKGGEAKLGDPLERWYRHLQALDHAMISNESAARAMDQALDVGGARLATTGDKENVITVRRNGDKVKYVVDDPLLHESLAATDGKPVSAMMNIFRIPTNILRQFTTHVPTFILMHAMRESMTAFTQGDFKPIIPIVDAIRGIRNSLVNSASAKALSAHGITGNFDYRPGAGQDRSDMLRARAAKQLGINITPVKGMAGLLHTVWGKYENVLKAADAGVRTRVYETEMAKHGNPAEAAYQSGAKAVNFQRRGSSPFMSYAFSAIPFLNARIQGTDLILRTAVNQAKNRGLAGVLFSRGMALAGMTAAYYMAVRNNDVYKKAETIYKDGYWIVPLNMFGGTSDEAVVMPIPFEAGVLYKNIPEHLLRYAFGDDKTEDFQAAMEKSLMGTLDMNPIPQVARPAIEVAANHSFFTGREIVPESRQMPGARQFEVEPGTSQLAKQLGKMTDYSPIDIDYLVRGYLGTVGEWVAEASDVAGRTLGDIPPLPNQFMDNPSLANTPLLKRFVRNSNQMGDDELNRLYDLHGETQGLVRTINRMEGAGDAEGIQKLVQENKGDIGIKDATNAVLGQISQLNKMEMNVQATLGMSGKDKSNAIKMIEDRKYALAQQVEQLRDAKKQIGAQP